MRRWTWTAAVAAMAASFLPPPVAAQTSDAVGIVTTIDGRATVARPALPSPLALKFKDDVFGRDRISTQENALVRVLLGGKAILTVRELSQVTISEEPGRAVVTLPDGKVVLAVAKQRMRPGESIEIRTPNAVAAVRGSVLAVGFDSATGVTTAFCGSGACTVQQGTGATVPLPVGQISINGQQRPATPAEANTLVNVQSTGREVTSPEQTTAALIQEQTNQATQVAQFVTTGMVSPFQLTSQPAPTVQSPSNLPTTSNPLVPAPPTGTTPETTPPPNGGPKGNVLVNPGFESGLTGWTLSGGGGVVSNLGSIVAPEGQNMALIHTGTGALPVSSFPAPPIGGFIQGSRLSQSFTVVGGSLLTIQANYNFISNEFPSQQVDDIFRMVVTSPSGAATERAFESRFTSAFQQSSEVAAALGFQTLGLPLNHGRTGFKLVTTQWAPENSGTATLSFEVFDRVDGAFDSAALIDAAAVGQDPPLYFLRRGDSLVRTGADPLLRLSNATQTFDSLMVVCCDGRATLAGPLLHATNSNLTVPWSLLAVMQGGALTTSSTDPLARLDGGVYTFGGSGVPMFDLYGTTAAVDPETGLTLGTHRPLQHAGSLLDASNATMTAVQAVRVDNALLEASAPLLALRNGSKLATAADTVQLSYQAKVTSLGSVVALDRAALTVGSGAALSLSGGSVLRVTGNLFSLTNGSSLSLLNGSLVSLSGGSILSVTGGLIGFGGSGGNLVSVTNSFCPCTTIGGIPVSLTGGALASNVSISGAIKNGGLGTVNLSPNAALIRVDGATTKVTIGGL
jgi:FecR-like protein